MENSEIFIGVCSILNVAMFAMWIKLDKHKIKMGSSPVSMILQ